MPTKNNAQISEPAEEMPILEPDHENKEPLPERVAKRPFVLENRRGSGGGNLTLMVTVVGAILLFGIGMLAFLSNTKTTKRKATAEAAKPNLGRVQTWKCARRSDPVKQSQIVAGRSREQSQCRSERYRKNQGTEDGSITNADQFYLANGQGWQATRGYP